LKDFLNKWLKKWPILEINELKNEILNDDDCGNDENEDEE
jgi:hypothetical protein